MPSCDYLCKNAQTQNGEQKVARDNNNANEERDFHLE